MTPVFDPTGLCEWPGCETHLDDENIDYLKLCFLKFKTNLCNEHYRKMKNRGARALMVPNAVDDLLCPWCGDCVPRSTAVKVRFDLDTGIEVGMEVCSNCQDNVPCPKSISGVHGEVYDGDYEGPMPPLPFEPDNQHGWCSQCAAPMVWIPERQRWVDFTGEPRPLTPRQKLAQLMDAFDAGDITDQEYQEALVGVLQPGA